MLSELAEAKLVESDLSDEHRVYLVKAYLGILHNIVRLCPDSRKIFRTANAVSILRLYLDRPQGLVRTKAYLILPYIITEDENDLINATDENIAYIVGILRDALESENHFSQVYAFWALEIACGLNHLAVNDSNKLRLGRLGALPLYVTLLRSSNVEEQSLAAAGLWILSFRHENKLLMKREPGCVEGESPFFVMFLNGIWTEFELKPLLTHHRHNFNILCSQLLSRVIYRSSDWCAILQSAKKSLKVHLETGLTHFQFYNNSSI